MAENGIERLCVPPASQISDGPVTLCLALVWCAADQNDRRVPVITQLYGSKHSGAVEVPRKDEDEVGVLGRFGEDEEAGCTIEDGSTLKPSAKDENCGYKRKKGANGAGGHSKK